MENCYPSTNALQIQIITSYRRDKIRFIRLNKSFLRYYILLSMSEKNQMKIVWGSFVQDTYLHLFVKFLKRIFNNPQKSFGIKTLSWSDDSIYSWRQNIGSLCVQFILEWSTMSTKDSVKKFTLIFKFPNFSFLRIFRNACMCIYGFLIIAAFVWNCMLFILIAKPVFESILQVFIAKEKFSNHSIFYQAREEIILSRFHHKTSCFPDDG